MHVDQEFRVLELTIRLSSSVDIHGPYGAYMFTFYMLKLNLRAESFIDRLIVSYRSNGFLV